MNQNSRMAVIIISSIFLTLVTGLGGSALSFDSEECTEGVEVTIHPGDNVQHFRFVDQLENENSESDRAMYEFERFDGSTVRFQRRQIRTIQIVALTTELRTQLEQRSGNLSERDWKKAEVHLGIDLSKVTNAYYKTQILDKIREGVNYPNEIKWIKTRAIVRWRNKRGHTSSYGHVNFESAYGRHDMDGTQRIQELKAQAEACEAEAIRNYAEFIRKL